MFMFVNADMYCSTNLLIHIAHVLRRAYFIVLKQRFVDNKLSCVAIYLTHINISWLFHIFYVETALNEQVS